MSTRRRSPIPVWLAIVIGAIIGVIVVPAIAIALDVGGTTANVLAVGGLVLGGVVGWLLARR